MQQTELGLSLSTKRTRKREFLAQVQRVVPWSQLEALIAPHAPEGRRGRPPFALGTMLRIHFLQQWFTLSDPAIEGALHDVPLFREVAGLNYDTRLPVVEANSLLHGQECDAFGDAGYQGAAKRPNARQEVNWHIALRPGKRRALAKSKRVDALVEQLEHLKASIRAKVEHPLRVVKRQFGHVNARYRGLKKNTAQLMTLFALGNLWLVRKKLEILAGSVRPKTAIAS